MWVNQATGAIGRAFRAGRAFAGPRVGERVRGRCSSQPLPGQAARHDRPLVGASPARLVLDTGSRKRVILESLSVDEGGIGRPTYKIEDFSP